MNGRNDGLAELLMQLAGNAAALIEKAKAAQVAQAARSAEDARTVNGEAVRRPAAADAKDAESDRHKETPPDPQTAALQDIIVQQAMKIHGLEAEVDRLAAALAEAQAALEAATAAAPKSAVKSKPAKPKARPLAPGGHRKG